MKTNLSMLVFFASLATQYSHGSCDDMPEKQELIRIMITTQAQQYLDKIPAPEPTCELNKQEFYDFLQQRITNSEKGDDKELSLFNDRTIGRLELSQLLTNNPNIRVSNYYRLYASNVWHRLVSIKLDCYPDYWNKDKEVYLKNLNKISGEKYRETAHAKYSDDALNQFQLQASHALAQEALRLFFQETKNQEEHE